MRSHPSFARRGIAAVHELRSLSQMPDSVLDALASTQRSMLDMVSDVD